MNDLAMLCVRTDATVRDVMACIDANAKGFALILDDAGRLVDTVTDGDVRRAIIAGIGQEMPIAAAVAHRPPAPHPTPLVATAAATEAELLHLMNEYTLRHIPIVDADGRPERVVLLTDLLKEYELPLRAVIMAGGFGARLRPLTDEMPKPMLPLGDRPLLQHIIEGLRKSGIRRMNVTTHYRGDVIASHFGDGSRFGVDINYVEEHQPLGTAGAVRLLAVSDEPVLVVNGDVLTQIDVPAMLRVHREQQAAMTVAVRSHTYEVPYGVIETDGPLVVGIQEKPRIVHDISAGVYLLSTESCALIPEEQSYDMPDLIRRLVEHRMKVLTFRAEGYWRDIGRHSDYDEARVDQQAGLI